MNGRSKASVQYLDEGWASSWLEKVGSDEPPKLQKGSIFKIPHHILLRDPNAYVPKVISLGPYHRNRPHLKVMEQVKLLYLRRILRRNPSIGMKNYLQLVVGLVDRSRRCYCEEINMELEENEFLDMLLLDGCFIVELLLSNREGLHQGGDDEDPILGNNTTTLSLVVFDMMLLENQLPLFVLEEIFNMVHASDEENPVSLIQLVIELFNDLLPDKISTNFDTTGTNFYHLLHILHSCFISPEHHQQNKATCSSQTCRSTNSTSFGIKALFPLLLINRRCSSQIAHTNTLEQKGSMSTLIPWVSNVRRKNDGSFGLFVCNVFNIVEVSPVKLNSQTNSLFRNLIVFEQFFFPKVKVTQVITYAIFMSYLIQSEKDLDRLEERKVITYTDHDDRKEEALFFRKLCNDTIVEYNNESYISNLRTLSIQVKKSYNIDWRRFRHKYHQALGSPQLQVIIALYALLYTAIQTTFTILSYYYPPK